MEQQIKAKMDFFGQLASIFTIPTIIALAYWMHLEIRSAIQDEHASVLQNFVDKPTFSSIVADLHHSDEAQWKSIQDLEKGKVDK